MENGEAELREKFERYVGREDWSAILVVAALVLEAGVVWWFGSDKPQAETIWLIAVDLTIAIGVYGEIRFANAAKATAAELQRISDGKVAATNRLASNANERAAAAELELEKLRQKQLPRSITDEQRDIFMGMVKDIPKTSVMVIFANNDYETTSFVQTMRYLLNKAGFGLPDWNFLNNAGIEYNPDRAVLANGWSLELYYGSSLPWKMSPLVEALEAAFTAAKIPGDTDVWAKLHPGLGDGQVEVFVRPKPMQ